MYNSCEPYTTHKAKLWRNYNMLIPYEVADALGVKPGEEIVFIVSGSGIRLEKGV